MVKYKVGDRVKFVGDVTHAHKLSNVKVGTIMNIEDGSLGISWDNWNDGHKLHGSLENNSGWWSTKSNIKLFIELTDKQRKSKIKKIIKEIESNKDFKESFKDVEKEVNSWSDSKIKRW